MTRRRDFLARTAASLGALAASPSLALAHRIERETALADWVAAELPRLGPLAAPERLAEDEAVWARIRQAYDLDPNVLNLDHGWTNPTPRA